jgi:hypothetical protein
MNGEGHLTQSVASAKESPSIRARRLRVTRRIGLAEPFAQMANPQADPFAEVRDAPRSKEQKRNEDDDADFHDTERTHGDCPFAATHWSAATTTS